MRIKFIILFMLAFSAASAQVMPEWIRTYNGSLNGNDEAIDIEVDGQGNVITAGKVFNTGKEEDICVIKYNPAGGQVWAVFYNGSESSSDLAHDITADNAGNVYVTGRTYTGPGNYDAVTIKYTAAGTQEWARVWSGSNMFDGGSAVCVDNAGNVYVSGSTQSPSSGYDYVTLKYTPAGALAWARYYSSPGNSYEEGLFNGLDAAGNIYTAGSRTSTNSGTDFLVVKYNSSGDSLWSRSYTGTNTGVNDIPTGFAVDAAGNSYITGFTAGVTGGTDYMTLKYNSSGGEEWQARYTSASQEQDIPEGLAIDAAGNVYVTGRSRVSNSYNDFATIKYNAGGAQEWLAVYNNEGADRDDYGYDIAVDMQGNVYVTGNSQSDGSNRDALTIKYSSAGNEEWVTRYDSTDSEEMFSIAVDNNGNVYVNGFQGITSTDMVTIKYSGTASITPVSTEIPSSFKLFQNYPNPFNPRTKFEFRTGKAGFISLKVYDMQGKEVYTLVNGRLSAGVYMAEFDGSQFSSGVYFYRLEAEGFSEMKKMVLVK